MKIKLFLFIGLLITSSAGAGTNASTGAEWIGIPTDAKIAALGGSVGAQVEGVESLGLNPAGLSRSQGTEALLTEDFWAQDVMEEHVGVGHELTDGSGLGFSFDYLGFGNVEAYSIGSGGAPLAQGVLSPNAMNFTAGYGSTVLPGLSLGLEAKLLLENLTGTGGSSVAGDLGALYEIKEPGLKFGLMLNNVGSDLNKAALPTQISLAASWQKELQKAIKNPSQESQTLAFMAQGDLQTGNTGLSTLELGSEYWYDHLLALRAGYRFAPYGSLTGVSGLAAGAGFRYQGMELSYAFVSMGDFGNSNQISLMLGF